MKLLSKIWAVLSFRQKNQFIFLIFLTLLNSIIDSLGIGLLYPLLNRIINQSQPNFLDNFDYVIKNFTDYDIVNIYIIIIFFFFILKNLFSIYYNYLSTTFASKIYLIISNKLYFDSLHSNLATFNKKNSIEYLELIRSDCNHLKSYLISFMLIISEVIFASAIVIVIFLINFKVAIFIISLFLLVFFFHFLILSKLIERCGKNSSIAIKLVSKNLLQAYNSFKEIKLFLAESFFIKNFFNANKDFAKNESAVTVLSTSNKNFIEIFIILFFFLFIYFSDKQVLITKVIPLVGVYLVAFFRIFPSLSRIGGLYSSLGGNYYGAEKALSNLINSHKQIDKNEISIIKPDFQINKKIELKSVFFKYDNKEPYVLENINVKFYKNEIVAITGKNGEGKSTLCNLILGFFYPEKGSIIIDNNVNIYKDLSSYRNVISFVSQKTFLLDDTIKNNIIFSYRDGSESYYSQQINHLDILLKFIKNLKNGINTEVGEDGSKLSGGQKQRIVISRGLYKKFDLIILDEIMNNLDSEGVDDVLSYLQTIKQDKIIILVSHERNVLQHCDKIYEVRNKNLFLVRS